MLVCSIIATIQDLEARVGRPFVSDEDKAMANAALEDASEIARAYGSPYWGCYGAEVTMAARAVPSGVKAVVLAMATRAMRNPDGFVSEMAGEYSYRYSENTSNGLAPSTGEITMLEKLAHKDKIRSLDIERAVRITRQKEYPYADDGDVIWEE